MALDGAVLRITATGIRMTQLLASIVILGIFSYFLAILTDHHMHIETWFKAVEGMSGAAVLYTGFAVILTLCLGGISFFAFLAILLDVCFIGAFAAIAVLNRGGVNSCNGYVRTPLGKGQSNAKGAGFGQDGFRTGSGENVTYVPRLYLACQLEKAVFAVAIINIVLFIISAFLQVFLAKHHQTEKRYGPSPSNNYTSGAGRRPFWRHNKKRHVARDAEVGAVGAKNHNNLMRPSHDTGYTGTTVGTPADAYGQPGRYGNEPVHGGHFPVHEYGHHQQTNGVTTTNAEL